MKGYPYVLVILLIFCIFSTGCSELMDITGMTAWMYDTEEPFGSVCTSPSAKLLGTAAGLDRDHCYQQMAVNMGDLTLCDKVERDPPMTKCYMLIAAKQNNPAVCDQVPPTNDPQAYLKIDCLWEVAMVNNNNAACEALGSRKVSRMFIGEMSRQSCLARLASGQAGTGRLT